jgi:hypothetical protein
MYGQFAQPGGREDRRQRGKVVNAAWNDYNVINAISLGSVALGWFASRVTETRLDRLTEERSLAGLTNIASGVGLLIVTALMAQRDPGWAASQPHA